MPPTTNFTPGGYRFIPAVFQYSGGVAALPGYEIERVRFRNPVRPGDRLLLVGKAIRLNRRQTIFNVQGFVGNTMVFHADVIGVPLVRKGEP